MKRNKTLIALVWLGVQLFTGFSWTLRAQSQDDEIVTVRTQEVTLDAVVRDKKGRPVRDLSAADFVLSEDGVPQEIRSFRFVTLPTADNAPPVANNNPNPPPARALPGGGNLNQGNPNQIGAVALVFDRLSPQAREVARQAALSYVGPDAQTVDVMGVFGLDLSLRTLQPFTTDGAALRRAVDKAAGRATSDFGGRTDQITGLSQRQDSLAAQGDLLQAQAAGGGAGAQTAGDALGQNASDQIFNQMTLRAQETFEMLERNQQGYATTSGLLALINGLSRLPGRKAIIYFSEGIALPNAVAAHFRNVISNANRANVSIYAVDAAGLRAQSADSSAGAAMTALGQKRARIAASTSDPTDGPMTRDLERNEDLVRLNPASGLGQLAGETGGLLVNNTNNPGERLRQVSEDLHSYYVLTYTPKNREYDGTFRQISLKTNRSNLEVQARKGYYAIGADYDSPVLPYEIPALAALSNQATPNALPAHIAAFNFPEAARAGLTSILVEVPASAINFVADNDKKTYRTDFSVVALVLDAQRRVVKKLSNQYVLSGPLDKLAAARKLPVLFYRETFLPAGQYSVAAAVYDATTQRSGTSGNTLAVAGTASNGLRLSSVVVIKAAERLTAADKQKPNPFYFGELLLYPNLGESLHKTTAKDLPLFVTVYPATGAAKDLTLKLELLASGRVTGNSSFNLPPPDETGRIQYATGIPLEKFQPGDYELRITVTDGQNSAVRSAKFKIEP